MKPIGHKDVNGKEICVGHTIICAYADYGMGGEEDLIIRRGRITITEKNLEKALNLINNSDTVEIIEMEPIKCWLAEYSGECTLFYNKPVKNEDEIWIDDGYDSFWIGEHILWQDELAIECVIITKKEYDRMKENDN